MAMKLYDLMSNSPVVEYLGDWPEGEEEVDWSSYVVFPSQWYGPDVPKFADFELLDIPE